MSFDLERASGVEIDQSLWTAHFGLSPKMSQTRSLVAGLGSHLYKMAERRPDAVLYTGTAQRPNWVSRQLKEQWIGKMYPVGLNFEFQAGPAISNHGNANRTSLNMGALENTVAAEAIRGHTAEQLVSEEARMALSALAEAALVVAHLTNDGMYPSTAAQLDQAFTGWLAHDTEAHELYDPKQELWQQKFVDFRQYAPQMPDMPDMLLHPTEM